VSDLRQLLSTFWGRSRAPRHICDVRLWSIRWSEPTYGGLIWNPFDTACTFASLRIVCWWSPVFTPADHPAWSAACWASGV